MEKEAVSRQCVSCGKIHEKKNLIRIVHVKETDAISIDPLKTMNGRGAYVCKDEACLKKMVKNRRLDRSLKKHVPIEIYDSLYMEAMAIEK